MPSIDFFVNDGEFAFIGEAVYSVRRGDKGDRVTPPVADAVDAIRVERVTSLGLVVGDQIIINERNVSRNMSRYWVSKIKGSRLLMERLEELCVNDMERGSDD